MLVVLRKWLTGRLNTLIWPDRDASVISQKFVDGLFKLGVLVLQVVYKHSSTEGVYASSREGGFFSAFRAWDPGRQEVVQLILACRHC